jgi:hypothetical protein
VIARFGIRVASSLAGVAVGLLLADALLSKLSLNATALLEATVIFWIVHLVVQFMALRVLVRQPSVALAGLLALGSTVIALIIVNAIVSGLSISGASTYVLATLIIWLSTAVADTLGRRAIRSRREERRD